jgi:MFS family permease
MGYAVAIPVFAPLFLSPSTWLAKPFPFETRAFLLGLALTLYAFAQFLGASFWSKLSSSQGVSKVLSITLLLTAVSHLMVGFGLFHEHLGLLFCGRALGGFSAGNASLATLAFSSPEPNSPAAHHSWPWPLLTGALGLSVGPLLAGVLADKNLLDWFHNALPFWAMSAIVLVNLVGFRLVAPQDDLFVSSATLGPLKSIKVVWVAMHDKVLRRGALGLFSFFVSWFLFVQYLSVFLLMRFGLTEHQIGVAFFAMGILWMLASFLTIKRARTLAFVGALALAGSLLEVHWAIFAMLIALFVVTTSFFWAHMGIFFAHVPNDEDIIETTPLFSILSAPAAFLATALGALLLLGNDWLALVASALAMLLCALFLTELPHRD